MTRPPVIEIVAHRGDPVGEPENTVASIRRAIADGARVVEVDVRLSAEGTPVLLHDATTERLWGRGAPVGRQSLAQLRALRAVGRRDAVGIPTLAEALGRRRRGTPADRSAGSAHRTGRVGGRARVRGARRLVRGPGRFAYRAQARPGCRAVAHLASARIPRCRAAGEAQAASGQSVPPVGQRPVGTPGAARRRGGQLLDRRRHRPRPKARRQRGCGDHLQSRREPAQRAAARIRRALTCAPGRTRTCGLEIRSHLLYPAELRGPGG